MSDSDLSDAPAIPSAAALEKSLRRTVIKAQKADEEVTVNDIRKRSARELGLDQDFFSVDPEWKAKSKEVIKSQFERGSDEEAEPETIKPSKKRSSPAPSPQPRKKSKSTKNGADKKQSQPKPSARMNTRSVTPEPAEVSHIARDDDSSSELSSLIDDAPAPRKPRSNPSDGPSRTSKAKSSKPSDVVNTDPDAEEIKRLQSWLVKCGIRKVWGTYLKPYPAAKDKIKHLKSMLADVGMTGRYSNEKATQIKEARELAADIEAVQEGNERWGKDGEDEIDDDEATVDRTKTGRKLVRGSKHFDFLSSDGEETD